MISVTRLLGGSSQEADVPARAPRSRPGKSAASRMPAPVVVWSATNTCKYSCRHCHAGASRKRVRGELSTTEARVMIDDLSSLGVPCLVIGGGEPLLRTDVFDIAEHAVTSGIRVVISSNGSLVTREVVERFAEIGLSDVAISICGSEDTHDRFRGHPGAYQEALRGIRAAQSGGIRVSVRFMVTGDNVDDLPWIFRLVEQEDIGRLEIHHLVYAGGSILEGIGLTSAEAREMMTVVIAQSGRWLEDGRDIEVLTQDNDCDGPFVVLWLGDNDVPRSEAALEYLSRRGGNAAGTRSAAIDSFGFVRPDRHGSDLVIGSIRERSFSEIWRDSSIPILRDLRNRKPLIEGRCALCRWLDICGGGVRARAASSTGDPWQSDPACYLLDEEVFLEKASA